MGRNQYQKHLDKSLLSLYTNRVKRMRTEEDLVEKMKVTQSSTLSTIVDENIRAIGEALVEAKEKGFPILRTPIVAGGAVRDYVYGFYPKDYDIFFDVSKIPEDEQEDAVHLFGLRVVDALVARKNSKYLSLEDNVLHRIAPDEERDYGEIRDSINNHADPSWEKFHVFETGPYSERIQRIWAQDMRDNHEADNHRFIKLQFIGRNDTRLSEEDPLPFVEAFDYDLVKGIYDPETKKYSLHKSFVDAHNSKKLVVDRPSTLARVNRQLYRYGKHFPCEIVDNTPKKETSNNLNIANLLLQPPLLDAQLLQNMWRQAVPELFEVEDNAAQIIDPNEAVQGWEDVDDHL